MLSSIRASKSEAEGEAGMSGLKRNLAELVRYPSAVAGLVIILIMILASIYTLITIPYSRSYSPVARWRGSLVQPAQKRPAVLDKHLPPRKAA